MDVKSVHLSGIKAGPDDELPDGYFEAYASTFIREPDSYGDVVKRGAFADTIKDWAKSGNTVPVLYGHDMADPFSNIGGAVELSEDDRGLLVKGQLDLENPKAMQVYRLLKGRRLNQLSFAYDVLEDGIVDLGDEQKARELRKLKLYEVSLVPIGANQDTEVLSVKSATIALKAGKVISSKNLEALKTARDALSAVIEAADKSEDTDEANQADNVDKGQAATSAKSSSRPVKSVIAAFDVMFLDVEND